MRTFHPQFSLAAITVILVGAVLVPGSTHAQGGPLCFPSVPGIRNCINGRFLEYWQANGGLPVFGYPTTPEYAETTSEGTFTVQYFERNRFEFHPEKRRPYDVLLGRLGDARLGQLQRNWQGEQRGHQFENCTWWAQTNHAICGSFREYWEAHGLNDPALDPIGRSLQLFGLPLTEPRLEMNSSGDVVLTQWFERARFELHRNKGILLGLLGSEVQRDPLLPYDDISFAAVDVDRFWSFRFAATGELYASPDAFVLYDIPIQTECGQAIPGNAFYCRLDYAIYLDRLFLYERAQLAAEAGTDGDMAMVLIIAHEFAHSVQDLRGILGDEQFYTIQTELQADCLAGVYVQDAESRGLLEEGDLDEALVATYAAGDLEGTPWNDPSAHGTPLQRVQAFLGGYQRGERACEL